MTLLGIILGTSAFIALLWLICRAIARTYLPERPGIAIYGEVIEVPTAAKAGGAAQGSSRDKVRTDDIAHRGKAI